MCLDYKFLKMKIYIIIVVDCKINKCRSECIQGNLFGLKKILFLTIIQRLWNIMENFLR